MSFARCLASMFWEHLGLQPTDGGANQDLSLHQKVLDAIERVTIGARQSRSGSATPSLMTVRIEL